MLERSARVPMSRRPAGMPTRKPAIQSGNDADGHVAMRVLALFGGGGDRVETDVGKEDDGAAGENAWPAVGREGMPVRGMNEARGKADEHEDSDDFEENHDVVGFGGLANAAHQDHRKQHDDDERRPVEAQMPAGGIEQVSLQVHQAAKEVRVIDPANTGMPAD